MSPKLRESLFEIGTLAGLSFPVELVDANDARTDVRIQIPEREPAVRRKDERLEAPPAPKVRRIGEDIMEADDDDGMRDVSKSAIDVDLLDSEDLAI